LINSFNMASSAWDQLWTWRSKLWHLYCKCSCWKVQWPGAKSI